MKPCSPFSLLSLVRVTGRSLLSTRKDAGRRGEAHTVPGFEAFRVLCRPLYRPLWPLAPKEDDATFQRAGA